MFRPKLAVWLLIAFVAAWLASCSSDVDGYHLATEESGASSAATGGLPPGAGAVGGAAGSGARSFLPTGGTDGDGSLGGAGGAPAGGAPAGGAGGGDTGGAQNGGAGGGVTGGAQNGGAGGGITGGAQNGGAGGGVTGGAQNGGTGGTITGGAPNTGGAPTGGRINTGGAPTGGAPTGGAPTGGRANTGGAPTGGAPTGGAPTGGAPTGGAPTGGVGGTGGAGGYPGDPTQVTLTGAGGVSGITAASWEPSAQKFYLLKPSTREYFVLSTDGTVTGPTMLQGSGTVASSVFGANANDVFFVTGSPTALFRQPIMTGTTVQLALPGSPAAGVLSGGYANGWFFVGNASGASQALNDGSTTFGGGASSLSGVYVVTTDTTRFTFRTVAAGNNSVVHGIAPPAFATNSSPCAAGGFSQYGSSPIGIHGNSVGWVILFPLATTQYRLNVATITNGSCGSPVVANFGTSSASQAVGLIDASHALVTYDTSGFVARVEILEVGNPTFTRTPLTNVNMGGAGFPVMFVVAKEASPSHYAVLVTKDIPALISF